MSRKKKWLVRAAAVLLGLILSEGVLQLAKVVSPRVRYNLSPPWSRVIVPDETLGIRMTPYYPGNDRWGYRNAAVPGRCDILAVGASMTYGFSASREESWPHQLELITGQSVYNMSCGGYGPCEFRVLIERGLVLQPKTVVMEIYPGNDASDSYASVYSEGRFPELRSRDEAVLSAMAEADRAGTMRQKAARLLGTPAPESRSLGVSKVPNANPVRAWFSEQCALYGLARQLYPLVAGKQYYSLFRDDGRPDDVFEVAARKQNRVRFDAEPRFRTVFLSPEYLALALDLDDPRIHEGQRIMETVLLAIQARLRAESVRLLVVVIPSKAVVYHELLRRHAKAVPASLFETIRREEQLTTDIEGFFAGHQIEFQNARDALRAGFARDGGYYHETDDSHVNRTGYQALAETVAVALKNPPR